MRCTCARAHVHTHFLYLRNGWADNVQIRYVVGDGSTDRFPQVIRGTLARSARAMRTRSSIANKASYWCGPPSFLSFECTHHLCGVWPWFLLSARALFNRHQAFSSNVGPSCIKCQSTPVPCPMLKLYLHLGSPIWFLGPSV